MESQRIQQQSNPKEKAGIFSTLFFWWIAPFLWKGYKQDKLSTEDLFQVLEEDESKLLGDILEREWNKELEKSKESAKGGKQYNASLLKAIIRGFGGKFALLGAFTFFEECILRILQPLLMSWFIQYFTESEAVKSKTEAYIYGLGIVAMSASYTLVHHQYFFGVMKTGMRIRVAHCSLIYRKSLKLSKKAMAESTVGQMVNMLSNDVNRFDMAPMFIHYLWCGPLQLIIIVVVTWLSIGHATLVGASLVVAFVPLQSWIGKKFSQLRVETAKKTDERIRIMSEIIQGIKVIKMYAWEHSFADLVAKARKAEIDVIQRTCFFKAFNMCFFFVCSKVVMALIFTTYVLQGDILTADKAFLTLALYNVTKLSMAMFFPTAISMVSETMISIQRIQNFLLLDESYAAIKASNDEPEGYVKLSQVKARWSEDKLTLDNITFEAKSGSLTAIVGPVGSGKGSTLNAILGEIPITDGKVVVKGQVSYASQEPWVFPGTLRQNVLFGQDLDPDRYFKVLEVCALNRDINQLEHGDLSLVGERGVALSGGQKARVNLARAIYRQADVYLLDDPLSAVDAHVGKHLFEACIKTFLKDKVVILVTHQIQYLKDADKIIVLKDGKITHQGNYESVQDIAAFLKDDHEQEQEDAEEDLEDEPDEDHKEDELHEKSGLLAKSRPKQAEEEAKVGTVSRSVYFEYLKSGAGLGFGFILVTSTIICHGCNILSDLWISHWTNDEDVKLDKLHHNSTDISLEAIEDSNQFYLMVYGALVLGLIIFVAISSIQYYVICMQASRTLHDNMFAKLLRANPRFFDVNPSGRVLNRFTKDLGSMDEVLPITAFDVLWLFCSIMCVFAIVSYIRPLVLIPTLAIGIIFYFLRKFYLKTSRGVKRLEAIAKSPIFTNLSATLNGLNTIRAFSAQDLMVAEFDHVQDIHSSAFFAHLGTARWFGVYLDWIVVIYLLAIVLSFLVMPSDLLGGGDVGVAINSCIFLTGALQYGMRQSAEAENHMTSVERVIEYGKLKTEADLKTSNVPKFDKGIVEMDKVTLKYDPDGQPVLKEVTFASTEAEKIGIVGRTGAGKSSLIMALFRLVEPECGTIKIDGMDTSVIGLHDLRKGISIIPQDPLLFTTSLRRNLDPFEEHTDQDIWSALEQAHLSEVVQGLREGLDTPMSEGGSNLSVGQRQLVCLARAILRRNKILILDEATANVDLKTDAMIQETIRDKFKACTVFTVAHRLNTVMDSDRILVMDQGQVVEFDSPSKLLENPDGFLTKLVNQTGSMSKRKLIKMAKNIS